MHRRLSSATQSRLREATETFLASAPLEESSVVFDGPGIGCTSHILVLGHLGLERLLRLGSIHSFSSSSYGTLMFLAKHFGMMTLQKEGAHGWNRGNQLRHKLTFPGRFLARAPRFLRKGFVFEGELTSAALASSVAPAFLAKTVGEIPSNFHFWVYNKTDGRLEDVHSRSSFAHWTMANVIRAACAVPYLYEPLIIDGKTYQDPMFAPSIKQTMRELRRGRNVLFWNMTFSARKEGLLAVKGHEARSGLLRILLDEIFFVLAIDNPEFDSAIELGFFANPPLP